MSGDSLNRLTWTSSLGRDCSKKKGAWYRVPDKTKLPEHAWAKGTAIKQDDTGVLFQFSKAFKKSQALATRMGVDWQAPEPK